MKSSIVLKTVFKKFTLIQLWVGATALALLPLLIAITYAAYALQQQTANQRQLMEAMDRLNTLDATISEGVTELARLARQFMLLKDDNFVHLYRRKLSVLENSSQELQKALALQTELHPLLTRITTTAKQVDQMLSAAAADKSDSPKITEQLTAMRQQSEQLSQSVDDYIRASVKYEEAHFNEVVDRLLLLCILALPGTLLLFILSTVMASRPILRLNRAINQLGMHQWGTPITISGPADLVALGENLEWMRQQICAADQQKKAFIQHVTHELKTPLASIIEAGNLLHDQTAGPLQQEQEKVLDILLNSAHNLQGLIQQLLNYNAVSHGLIPHYQPLDITELCENIRQKIITTSVDRQVQWHLSGTPKKITSDPTVLEMILSNLLSNAWHFIGTQGDISVTWEVTDNKWQLVVSDTGPGIDEEELSMIFKPFYKGKAGRRDTVPRSGIGLAIVQECITNLKGNIRVTSAIGSGTSFVMTFPLAQGDNN